MMPSTFIIAVLGTLLALENRGKINLYSISRDVAIFIRQGLRLLWQTVALIFIHSIAVRFAPIEWVETYRIFGMIPIAYLLGCIERESVHFRLCSFILAFFAIEAGPGDVVLELCFGVSIAFAIMAVEILILGVYEKVRFSRIAEPIRGLPLLFMISSLVLLALWVIQGAGSEGLNLS